MKNYTVRSTVNFTVSLAQTESGASLVKVTNADTNQEFTSEKKAWNSDRLGYRQLRNRQLSASSMFYSAADEAYVTDPNNPLVWLEDRNGDNIGETLRPGDAKLKTARPAPSR
ncbi:hypothetical protein BH11MYX2_BH11MYX2_31790 [soil metagenome]